MAETDRGDIRLDFHTDQAEMHPAVQRLGNVFAHYHGLRVATKRADRPTSEGFKKFRITTGKWADKIGSALYTRYLLITSKLSARIWVTYRNNVSTWIIEHPPHWLFA